VTGIYIYLQMELNIRCYKVLIHLLFTLNISKNKILGQQILNSV